VDEWLPYLDALEEWVRRVVGSLGDTAPPLPPVMPGSPVPQELVLRAKVLVETLVHAQDDAGVVRTRMQREQAYGAA
jgi:hypothetical protein